MAAEKKTATPAVLTSYLVLRFDDVGPDATWFVVAASVKAGSANGAIRQVVPKLQPESQAGKFVAVPSRSWKPVTVQPQTTIRLELTEAKP